MEEQRKQLDVQLAKAYEMLDNCDNTTDVKNITVLIEKLLAARNDIERIELDKRRFDADWSEKLEERRLHKLEIDLKQAELDQAKKQAEKDDNWKVIYLAKDCAKALGIGLLVGVGWSLGVKATNEGASDIGLTRVVNGISESVIKRAM